MGEGWGGGKDGERVPIHARACARTHVRFDGETKGVG